MGGSTGRGRSRQQSEVRNGRRAPRRHSATGESIARMLATLSCFLRSALAYFILKLIRLCSWLPFFLHKVVRLEDHHACCRKCLGDPFGCALSGVLVDKFVGGGGTPSAAHVVAICRSGRHGAVGSVGGSSRRHRRQRGPCVAWALLVYVRSPCCLLRALPSPGRTTFWPRSDLAMVATLRHRRRRWWGPCCRAP